MKEISCDVLVAGSGAAGLAAAFAAHEMGLNVIVAEKAPYIGGTTAWSGGEIWVPASTQQRQMGIPDTIDAAKLYLETASEGRADAARIKAYVEHAAEALDYFVAREAMAVEVMADAPDYFDTLPGAHQGGRTLRTVPFDGRELGADFKKLRDPLLAGQIFGGLSVAREDLVHLQAALHSPRSFLYVTRLLLNHAWQKLSGLHRGARTTMGNALIARLFSKLKQKQVPIWLSSSLEELIVENGKVTGANIKRANGIHKIHVSRGVVLATGGFSHDLAMQNKYYAHVASGSAHVSLPPQEVTGDGISLALEAGSCLRSKVSEPAAWTAVSTRKNETGVTWSVPHFGDRAKPGVIAVLSTGRRFANEASNYHDFCLSLIKASTNNSDTKAFLVTDHRALRRYGLGRVGPFPAPLGSHIKCGYLFKAKNLRDLGICTGIDPDNLIKTVNTYNVMAQAGIDRDFNKGASSFERSLGDSDQKPNPCMAPLETGPFYAIQIEPGNLSTFVGLDTTANAEVLSNSGRTISGLYALGADAESLAGGSYPAAGITLGPAITFAYLAARALASGSDKFSDCSADAYKNSSQFGEEANDHKLSDGGLTSGSLKTLAIKSQT